MSMRSDIIFPALVLAPVFLVLACGPENGGEETPGDISGVSFVKLAPEAMSTPVSVVLEYEIDNDVIVENLTSYPECGICWDTDGTPVIEDNFQAGPKLTRNSGKETQVISNVLLDYGKTYYFRAYFRNSREVYYSEDIVEGRLGEEQSEIKFDWTRLDTPELPSSVSVYFTDSPLDGRPFNAWYAVADVTSSDVELKVNLHDRIKTVDEQAAEDPKCCVLVNAAYFLASGSLGISVVGGSEQGMVTTYRGSLRPEHPEYNSVYPATRGIFGVDADGVPSVYWTGSGGAIYYYDRPLPSLIGSDPYAMMSPKLPSAPVDWKPEYAISAGPVLLYDGKCPFDFTLTGQGEEYYMHNFEMIPYDIFGDDVRPDRTAVGYTEDGRVILFICDGRCEKSDGALLTELAMIMKGLGCTYAVNYDGGGSTRMIVGSENMNDVTAEASRQVWSSIGFYRK
mgnify:CR=1 FL=1